MKKVVATALTLLLALSSLTACVAPAPSKEDSSSTPPSSSSEAVSVKETTGYTLPICKPGEEVTLSIAVQENGYAPASYANNLEIFQEFEKRTGVKLEWQVYPGSEFNQVMTTRLASGNDLPDMLKVPGDASTLVKLAKDKLIVPISQPIDQYATNLLKVYQQHPDMRSGATLSDGNVYAIPYSYHEQRYLKMPVIMIRQDWLDKLELPMPETLEDWEKTLIAFQTKDPNGNGKADEIPMGAEVMQMVDGAGYGIFSNAWGLRYGSASFGKSIDEAGKVRYDQIQPEFKEYLKWMNQLYSKKLIHPDLVVASQTLDQVRSGNQLGVTIAMVGTIPTYNAAINSSGAKGANFVPVLPPKNPKTGKQVQEVQNGILHYFAISKDCKNVDVAVKWLDYFYASEEGRRMAHWGIEGKTYTMVDGKPQFTDLVVHNPDGLDMLSVLRSIGSFNNFLMFRDIDFMKAVSKPVEVEFSNAVKDIVLEPFPTVVPTEDEARKLSSLLADILPYENEMVSKFIMGIESLDEFDDFVATMKSLKIEEAVSIWQAQYDRLAG